MYRKTSLPLIEQFAMHTLGLGGPVNVRLLPDKKSQRFAKRNNRGQESTCPISPLVLRTGADHRESGGASRA